MTAGVPRCRELPLPEEFSIAQRVAENMQPILPDATIGSDVDVISRNHRRRNTSARNLAFPEDILSIAPRHRELRIGSDPRTILSSKLRPVRRERDRANRQEHRQGQATEHE